MTRRFDVKVISPQGHGNALGRALSLADLASEAFGSDSVKVFAPEDGPIWEGASRYVMPVHRFSPTRRPDVQEVPANSHPIVWAIKPIRTSWRLAEAVKRKAPAATLILDIDDADEALSKEFAANSMANRVRLHPLNPLSPWQIRRTLQKAVTNANAVTFASDTVRDALNLNLKKPTLRIPHPRHRYNKPLMRETECRKLLHLGFFGTIRTHKGFNAIERTVLSRAHYRLHIFRGALPSGSNLIGGRQVVEHEVDAPMEDLYASIDLALLPQDMSFAARAQLPAKLLDAMRFGKPVMASRTPAIVEALGGDAVYIDNWNSESDVQNGIEKALSPLSLIGEAARRHFDEDLALEANVDPLRQFVRQLSDEPQSEPKR